GQFFDRKNGSIRPRDLAKHISAFANASGGLIAIGVDDNGTVSGITADQENHFRQAPIDFLLTPPPYQIEVVSVNIDGKSLKIMLFHISSYDSGIIKLRDGKAYQRYGDSSRELNHDQLLALEYSRGIRNFEANIVPYATLNDLDMKAVKDYAEIVSLEYGNELDLLKSRALIIPTADNEFKITNAGIILFGKRPTQFLPSARVRFLRYEGTTAGVGTDFNLVKEVTLEKPLVKIVEEAKSLISAQLREFQRLDKSGKFVKIPEYPAFAWVEGLINAVTHRDYSISGDHIRIIMFDDRMEFFSPGCLPNIVTIENIKETRYSRNPLIARVLADYGYVRELNEGVKRMYIDMENMFLDPPEFSEPNKSAVKLVLKNNYAMRSVRRMESIQQVVTTDIWNELNSFEQEIVIYMTNMGQSRLQALAFMTGKSARTVREHMKKLIVMGIVKEHAASPNDPHKYFTIGE
ncbi:MAG: putative DNA binding domain-containing protein, partial [Megasphaera sp.]|nr:putative DNA binding domain-containing protein [Megasphaera sp.]